MDLKTQEPDTASHFRYGSSSAGACFCKYCGRDILCNYALLCAESSKITFDVLSRMADGYSVDVYNNIDGLNSSTDQKIPLFDIQNTGIGFMSCFSNTVETRKSIPKKALNIN